VFWIVFQGSAFGGLILTGNEGKKRFVGGKDFSSFCLLSYANYFHFRLVSFFFFFSFTF